MHLHEILRAQLQIAQERFGALHILETGTIRGETKNYAADDGWSTLCFADWTQHHGGQVTSIDLDVQVALRVLAHRQEWVAGKIRDHGPDAPPLEPLRVNLLEDHSVHALGVLLLHQNGLDRASSGPVHVAYLDSDNDPTLILCEYLLVTQMMPQGGIVMVDDADFTEGALARKAHAIAPWLRQRAQPYEIVQRSGEGYSTGVLITEIR